VPLPSNRVYPGYPSWRLAILHPDPEPILTVAREFREFSLVLSGGKGGVPAPDEDPDVWIVHQEYVVNETSLFRRRARAPVVIAVAPSDGSAGEWFARGVLDFLVDPLERGRLRGALDRARHYLERAHALDALRLLAPPPSLIALLTPRRVVFLAASEIDWAQAATNGLTVCARARQYPVRESLADFAARLPSGEFIRLRRSLIVSLRCLKAVESRGHGELTVTLKGGRRIAVGPTYRRAVERLIESGSAAVRSE